MAKLSVIVCVYNTKIEYLSDCLNSIKKNTQKDLEIILVDDGSTVDYSGLIKKYDNVKYIKTENQGTLAARLEGIKNASGEYLCFADSDDTMSFCYYEPMVKALENQNADICINDWAFNSQNCFYYCNNDSTIKSNLIFYNDEILNKFFAQQGKEHSYYVLWNKVFRHEILQYAAQQIESLNLPKILFAEDVLISYFAFKQAKKLINVHLGFYFYHIHSGQQIDIESQTKLKDHIEKMALVFDIIENDLKKENILELFSNDFFVWKNLLCTVNYLSAKRYGYKELFEIIKNNYRIKDIKKLPKDHDAAYKKQKVLPENIYQIDTAIQKVYYSNRYLKIYAKNKSYALFMLKNMKTYLDKRFGLEVCKNNATFVFEKEKISAKQKLLHSNFVQQVGKVLFPKGSKIRKFLKSKL